MTPTFDMSGGWKLAKPACTWRDIPLLYEMFLNGLRNQETRIPVPN